MTILPILSRISPRRHPLIFAIALLTSATASPLLVAGPVRAESSTSKPVFIDVDSGGVRAIARMSAEDVEAAADAAGTAAGGAALESGDVLALRLRGAPICAAMLSESQRASLERIYGAGISQDELAVRYDSAVRSLLMKSLERARLGAPGGQVAVYGLPLERSGNAARVASSNRRMQSLVDACDALVSSRNIVALGDGATSAIEDGLRIALKQRGERPLYFRLNGEWQVIGDDAGLTASLAHRGTLLTQRRPSSSLRSDSSIEETNHTHKTYSTTLLDASSAQSGQSERRVYWAGKGTYEHLVRLDGSPLTRDRLVLFYANDLGLYPKFWNGSEVHGGIPQRSDLQAHLTEVDQDVAAAIPDAEWDGFAVIDYEAWFPVWERLKPEYQQASIDLVRQQHPSWSGSQAEEAARQEFEAKAREFMEQTLLRCQALRPNAKWGFWGFGRPWHQQYRQLDWIWERSTAFYPSLYVTHVSVADGEMPDEGHERTAQRHRDVVRWTLDFVNSIKNEQPVVPFVWARYSTITEGPHNGKAVNDLDLHIMLNEPWAYGIEGLALWENCTEIETVSLLNRLLDERLNPAIEEALLGGGQ